MRVCTVDFQTLAMARDSSVVDFEDAVRVAAAVASGLDAIVTRNGADFVNSPLPVLTLHFGDPQRRIYDLADNRKRLFEGS